jgi:hypothetical protein
MDCSRIYALTEQRRSDPAVDIWLIDLRRNPLPGRVLGSAANRSVSFQDEG